MRRRNKLAVMVLTVAALGAPASAQAALTTFGSTLTAPATLNTADNVLPGGHNGSDAFLWGASAANQSPADGQITDIKVKGCLNLSKGASPAASTGIEFQDLTPQPDGSFATQNGRTATGFQMPQCTAGAPTSDVVTDFKPVNLCTNTGHFVDFAYNGDFSMTYPNGVPYQVLGRVPTSSFNSFILYPGGQESVFKPGDQGQGGGFYNNPNEELLLQATVGTGPDGTGLCHGGTAGLGGGGSGGGGGTGGGSGGGGTAGPVALHPQTDGVNRKGVVKVAIYCALAEGCKGTATLTTSGKASVLASHSFKIRGKKTSKVALKLGRSAIGKIRKNHRKLKATLIVTVGGQRTTQAVKLKI